MRKFLMIWFGQTVSLLGSAMTAFAIPVWISSQTGRVQDLALLSLAFLLPGIVMSPLAGAIVDRYSRKWMMILADSVSGLLTSILLWLVATDQLQLWHLYVTTIINGCFHTLQWPAFSATISLLVPKAHYGRASGLQSLAQSVSEIMSPILAGALVLFIGLQGILLIDLATFLVALIVLLVIRFPELPKQAVEHKENPSIWRDASYGFRYIGERPSLLGLQAVFTLCNFLTSLAFTSLAAMILNRSEQNTVIWSQVSAIGGIGGFLGGLLMSTWGGPQLRIHGVLLGWAGAGLFGILPLGIGRVWPLWAAGLFTFFFAVPFMNGSNQAIWQAKVKPEVQGRVFAIRRMIAWMAYPIAKLLVIPLADWWLEPAMRTDSYLASQWSWLVGTGPGSGIALIFVFTGVLVSIVSLSAYGIPLIRNVEKILPDHSIMVKTVVPDT